jgi:hypothetical protein
MENPSTKSGIVLTEIDYKVIKSVTEFVPKMMKQKLEFEPWGICSFKNNFAFKLVEDTMAYLIQAGIPQHVFNYFVNFDLTPIIGKPKEPRVFSFSDLKFGFVIWLIACGISTAVFICEILWKFVSTKIQKAIEEIIGLILFLNAFQNFNLFQLG